MIRHLVGWELLDSRGRPTVAARCELESGAIGTASVPSGASRGDAEAKELRDGDPRRYRGWGCRKAVTGIENAIATSLRGKNFPTQDCLDHHLKELDGTEDKSNLGANALLAVSLAFCRAQAVERGLPLYRHLMALGDEWTSGQDRTAFLPRMTINLFSGGKHAGEQVAIQDLLVVPVSASTIDAGLANVFAVYQAASDLIWNKYGMRVLRADEGGLAPPFPSTESMFEDAVTAIEAAGLRPGTDMALAVDVAASHFFAGGAYHLDGKTLSGESMLEQLVDWCRKYPIISLEDGLAEDDWNHWIQLRAALDPSIIVLGDDHLCTNPPRIARAVQERSASGLLLKVNQIGTLTEAGEACRLARASGWQVTVSARSGETEDNWLADLAVAWGDQIKVGSITQSERLAKYNRLLEIERETGWPVNAWPHGPRASQAEDPSSAATLGDDVEATLPERAAQVPHDSSNSSPLSANPMVAPDKAPPKDNELESAMRLVTHDLRAPLRAIHGFAQALEEDFAAQLGEQGLKYTSYIGEASQQMDQLIVDLMTYTRVGRGDLKRSRVDMGRVLNAAIDELKEDIERQGAHIAVPAPLPVVLGHHDTLVHVVRQLLSNAILYVPTSRKSRVVVRAEPRRKYWRIWFEDNGIGIPKEYHERIFGIVERLHGVEAYPGSGLGLAIARRGARNLGGECGVESEPDRGSRFWIDLPSETSES